MKRQSLSPPSETYPYLFKKVHELKLFPDAKVMSDVIPKTDSITINKEYDALETINIYILKEFLDQHFEIPNTKDSDFQSDKSQSVTEHIERLWSVLRREKDVVIEGSSLIPLPYPYIVPGGRFNEIYYWDSYFTMLGLQVSGHVDLIESMADNFAHQIDLFGHIPNGNRSYFLSRSQPPFFSLMVQLLAEEKDESIITKYLPQLITEHAFWMDGASDISIPSQISKRLAILPKGAVLNRYYDALDTPRDEMFPDDVELAHESDRNAQELYRDIRAACESGWDFSARWFDDPNDLSTIKAASIIPVDLNCLLYNLEKTIAKGYDLVKNEEKRMHFERISEQRQKNILSIFWNQAEGFFFDYLMHKMSQSDVYSLAAVYPLYFHLATKKQATRVAQVIEKQFLKPGGLVSTTIHSGQQWDAPNGWAPLQYISIVGLKNYGFHDLADEIAQRWLALNESIFKSTGKMMEKYNVEDLELDAGGGEYPVQDGFGWTNGVYLALKNLN